MVGFRLIDRRTQYSGREIGHPSNDAFGTMLIWHRWLQASWPHQPHTEHAASGDVHLTRMSGNHSALESHTILTPKGVVYANINRRDSHTIARMRPLYKHLNTSIQHIISVASILYDIGSPIMVTVVAPPQKRASCYTQVALTRRTRGWPEDKYADVINTPCGRPVGLSSIPMVETRAACSNACLTSSCPSQR